MSIARMAGRAVLPKLFAEGLSANKALDYLKSIGKGYRRKTFLSDWRELTGAEKLKDVYKYIPKKYALSYNLMAPTETKQAQEFKYVFRAKTTNMYTGEEDHTTISMGSDTRYSPEQAEYEMSDIMNALDEEYLAEHGYIVSDIALAVVFRRRQ